MSAQEHSEDDIDAEFIEIDPETNQSEQPHTDGSLPEDPDDMLEPTTPKHVPPVDHQFPNQDGGNRRTKIEINGYADEVNSWILQGLNNVRISERIKAEHGKDISARTVCNYRKNTWEPYAAQLDKEALQDIKGYDDDGTAITTGALVVQTVFKNFKNQVKYAEQSVEFWDTRMAEILSMGPALYTTNATIHKSLIVSKQQHEKYVEKLDKLMNGENGLITLKKDTIRKMADISIRLFASEIGDNAKRSELIARFKELIRTV